MGESDIDLQLKIAYWTDEYCQDQDISEELKRDCDEYYEEFRNGQFADIWDAYEELSSIEALILFYRTVSYQVDNFLPVVKKTIDLSKMRWDVIGRVKEVSGQNNDLILELARLFASVAVNFHPNDHWGEGNVLWSHVLNESIPKLFQAGFIQKFCELQCNLQPEQMPFQEDARASIFSEDPGVLDMVLDWAFGENVDKLVQSTAFATLQYLIKLAPSVNFITDELEEQISARLPKSSAVRAVHSLILKDRSYIDYCADILKLTQDEDAKYNVSVIAALVNDTGIIILNSDAETAASTVDYWVTALEYFSDGDYRTVKNVTPLLLTALPLMSNEQLEKFVGNVFDKICMICQSDEPDSPPFYDESDAYLADVTNMLIWAMKRIPYTKFLLVKRLSEDGIPKEDGMKIGVSYILYKLMDCNLIDRDVGYPIVRLLLPCCNIEKDGIDESLYFMYQNIFTKKDTILKWFTEQERKELSRVCDAIIDFFADKKLPLDIEGQISYSPNSEDVIDFIQRITGIDETKKEKVIEEIAGMPSSITQFFTIHSDTESDCIYVIAVVCAFACKYRDSLGPDVIMGILYSSLDVLEKYFTFELSSAASGTCIYNKGIKPILDNLAKLMEYSKSASDIINDVTDKVLTIMQIVYRSEELTSKCMRILRYLVQNKPEKLLEQESIQQFTSFMANPDINPYHIDMLSTLEDLQYICATLRKEAGENFDTNFGNVVMGYSQDVFDLFQSTDDDVLLLPDKFLRCLIARWA